MDEIIDLGKGHPTPSLLPTDEIQAAIVRLSEPTLRQALTYGAHGGPMAIRQKLADFLSEHYRICVSTDELALCSGISLSIDMACQLFARPNDIVVCEDPTYFHARAIFANARLRMHGLPVDNGGLRVDLLEQALADGLRPALVYCIPSFHNPTGVTLESTRAERLVALADAYDFLILADEPYNLLHFDSDPPPCMISYDRERARVLSLGSFSKILAPGLRTGWVHGHKSIIEQFTHHGALQSGGGLNPLAFAVIADLIRSGILTRKVNSLRTIYMRRAQALAAALRTEFPGIDFLEPRGGYFLWLTLPLDKTLNESHARAHGVSFTSGSRCAVSRDLGTYMRLCFAYYNEEKLRDGVHRLAASVHAL